MSIVPANLPRSVSQPLSINPAARRSLLGIGGYLDKDAQMWLWPIIGGQIQYSNGLGKVDIYRIHEVDYSSAAMRAWYKKIIAEVKKLKAQLVSNGIVIVKPGNKIEFDTQYDFERFLQLNFWNSAVLNIYEQFPRGGSKYAEKFYCWSFLGAKKQIPWRFKVQPGSFEVYIEPPSNSLAGITRVRINKGIWSGLCQLVGFKSKMSAIVWEDFYKQYTSQIKFSTIDDIINLLSKRAMNPVEYVSPIKLDQLDYIIMTVLILKIYEQTRQSIDLPDWKLTVSWHSIVRKVSDSQVEAIFQTISKDWALSQIRLPSSDLPHVAEINILPVTTSTSVYKQSRLVPGFNDLEGEAPAVVSLNEIVTNTVNDEPKELPVYDWVEIKCYNAVDNQTAVAYNRLFGSYHAASIDQEATIIISSVFPQDLYTSKPVTIGMKLEKRHWTVTFETFQGVNPIVQTAVDVVHFLFGQASIYGPNHYLVDINDFITVQKLDDNIAVNNALYGLPNAETLSNIGKEITSQDIEYVLAEAGSPKGEGIEAQLKEMEEEKRKKDEEAKAIMEKISKEKAEEVKAKKESKKKEKAEKKEEITVGEKVLEVKKA